MANYVDLITRVIGDFDEIWTSLKKKGDAVKDFKSTGLVPTNDYSTIIDSLTYIKGSNGLNAATLYDSSSSQELKGATVVNNGTTFTVNAAITNAGYYAADAKVNASITATTVNLATARTAGNFALGDNGYSLVAQNYAIGTITAAQGTVSNDAAIIAGTYDDKGVATESPITTNLTLENDTTVTNVQLADSAFKVKVKAGALTTGTVSAKTVSTVTEGYVTTSDKAADAIVSHAINSTDEDSIEFSIKAGGVTVKTKEDTTATAAIAGDIIMDSASAAGDYALTATITGLQLDATVTEGYVTAGTTVSVGDVSTTAGTKYIKKGYSNDQEIALAADTGLSVTAGNELLADSGKTLTITASGEATADISEGYIKANEAGTITVSGTKTVKIKESTASAKYKINSYGKSGTGSSIFTEGTGGAYTLTVTPVVAVVPSATAGWIDGAANITTGVAENSLASVSYSIAAGSVNVDAAPSFAVTAVERDNDGSGKGTMTDIGTLFIDDIPDAGDYFKVETGVGYTVTEGYVTASTGTPKVSKYVRKAVIEHVDTGVNGEDYYQVTTGGYLPSGVLSNISTVTPTIATVPVTLSSTQGVLSSAIATGKTASDYHKITVAKGAIDAGYISNSKGTLSGEAYIAKGHAAAAPTISATKAAAVARKVDGSSVVYEAVTTITANSNLNVTEGYITAAEVDSAEANVTKTETSTFEINRVVFGTTTHTTNASVNASNGIIAAGTDETVKYTVTPKIDSCSTQFTVNTAGYVSAADTDILRFANVGADSHNGEMTPFAIHAGTGIASQGEASQTAVTLTDNFATNASGDYTVTVGGTVSKTINLDPGYYGTSESAINVTTAVTKELTVARGAVSATAGGSNAITAGSVTLHDDNTATGKTFYEIDATANVTVSKGVTTAGYVKTDADVTATGATLTDKVFVEAYLGNTRGSQNVAPEGTENFATITIGQGADYALPAAAPATNESVTLATAAKYSQKDTVVTLSAHAMGSAVIGELARLEARLLGVE